MDREVLDCRPGRYFISTQYRTVVQVFKKCLIHLRHPFYEPLLGMCLLLTELKMHNSARIVNGGANGSITVRANIIKKLSYLIGAVFSGKDI